MKDRVPETVAAMDESEALAAFASSTIAMVLTNPRLEDNPIIYVNRAFETLTGYTSSMAVGRNCRFLQGEATSEKDVARLRRAISEARNISLIIDNHRADGTPFRNAVLVTPIRADDDEIAYFLGLQREVESDEQTEIERIEKILTEIQHRVKNHLSMIVGMIRLQARAESAEQDFQALSRRVESLQLLYEEMNAASDGRNADVVDLGAYLARVSNAVAHIDGRPGIRVNIDTEPFAAPTDIAVNVGLIVSELLTNALTHGFDGRDSGLVEVKASRTMGDGVRIIIADDGIGLPGEKAAGLGTKILDSLVKNVDGVLDYVRSDIGTTVVLDIPARQAEPLDEI